MISTEINEAVLLCVAGFAILAFVSFILMLILLANFYRDYKIALQNYKELLNRADLDDIDQIYNREFPADFSRKEMKEWTNDHKE